MALSEHAREFRIENAFHLAQQAIEESLKVVLVHVSVPVPLIYDLGALLALLPRDLDSPYGYELNELNQYALTRCYQEGAWVPAQEELQIVIGKTRETLDWAKGVVIGNE